MSNETETRDRAILDAIASLSSDLNGKMNQLAKDVTEIKIGQAELKGEIKAIESKINTVEGKLIGEIKALDNKIEGVSHTLEAKMDGIDTRVGNLEFLNRVGVSALIGGIVALIVKIFL